MIKIKGTWETRLPQKNLLFDWVEHIKKIHLFSWIRIPHNKFFSCSVLFRLYKTVLKSTFRWVTFLNKKIYRIQNTNRIHDFLWNRLNHPDPTIAAQLLLRQRKRTMSCLEYDNMFIQVFIIFIPEIWKHVHPGLHHIHP